MSTDTVTQQPAPATEKASRWEDFVDIFFSPTALFRRRANDSWVWPLIVLAALSTILYFAFPSVNRAFSEAQMASRNMTPEQQAAAQRMGGTFMIIGGLFVPIVMALIILIGAAILWLGAKLTGILLTFRQSLMINAYVGLLTILQQLIVSVISMFKVNRGEALDPFKDRATSIIRFIDTSQMPDVLVALLSRIDIFAFWALIWTAIALIAVSNAPKGRAYAAATFVWFVAVIPALIGVAFSK
jgi:hypothetical protein